MISFSRLDKQVVVDVDHGIWGVGSNYFRFTIDQQHQYQAKLLMEALQEHMDNRLSRLKEKYYREGWKAAKAKTRKETDFYGGWE